MQTRTEGIFAFVVLFMLISVPSAFALDLTNYKLVGGTIPVTVSAIVDKNVVVDATRITAGRLNRYFAIDDVAVVQIKYSKYRYNLEEDARAILASLLSNGLIKHLPDHVIVKTSDTHKLAYVVIPIIDGYDDLSKYINKINTHAIFSLHFQKEYNNLSGVYEQGKNIWPYDADTWYIFADSNRVLTIKTGVFPDELPDELDGAMINDRLIIMHPYREWKNEVSVYNSPVLYVLASKVPTAAPTVVRDLLSESNSSDFYFGLLKAAEEYAKADREIGYLLKAVFGDDRHDNLEASAQYLQTNSDVGYFQADQTMAYENVKVYFDTNIPDGYIPILESLSKQNFEDICKLSLSKYYCIAKLNSAVQTFNYRSRIDNEDSYALLWVKETKNNTQISEPQIKPIPAKKPHIVQPDVTANISTKYVGPKGSYINIEISNPNDTNFLAIVRVKTTGAYMDIPDSGNVEFEVPAHKKVSKILRVVFVSADTATVDINVITIATDIPGKRYTKNFHFAMYPAYYGIYSFCADENRMVRVINGKGQYIIHCESVGKHCYQLTNTYAECRINKPVGPEGQLDEQYNRMFSNTNPTKEIFLFGATGAGATILDAISSFAVKGGLSNALRSLSFWEAILSGLLSVGAAYYLFKLLPDDCRLKPILGVLSPVIGLLAGAEGLLISAGATYLLCLFGGKVMKK